MDDAEATMTIRLPRHLKERICQEAKRQDLDASKLVRKIARRALTPSSPAPSEDTGETPNEDEA